MHDITYNNIKIIDLKLKKIFFYKERLLLKKPNKLNYPKYKEWQNKLNNLKDEEENLLKELEKNYQELEKYL